MRDLFSCRRARIPFGGSELWLKTFLLFLERPHSRQGSQFLFEVTEFRVKTFFFGDHLAVKGTKIPFNGRELWVKTFIFFFGDDNIQRSARGPHWGKLPTSNCKAFSLKISTRSLTVDLKKRLSRKRNCISYRAIKRSAAIVSYDSAILSHF